MLINIYLQIQSTPPVKQNDLLLLCESQLTSFNLSRQPQQQHNTHVKFRTDLTDYYTKMEMICVNINHWKIALFFPA